MSNTRRCFLSVLGLFAASLPGGCIVKFNRGEGLCFKPLFRVRFQLNRADDEPNVAAHRGPGCRCHQGGAENGGYEPAMNSVNTMNSMQGYQGESLPFMGQGFEQGGVLNGAASVDAGPYHGAQEGFNSNGGFDGASDLNHGPIHPSRNPSYPSNGMGPVHAKPVPMQGMDYPLQMPNSAPLAPPMNLSPVPTQGNQQGIPQGVPQGSPPAVDPGQSVENRKGDSQKQQTAKKRPGSLRLGANLVMRTTNVLRVGERVIFAIDVDNTGDASIESTKLEGVFSENLVPISVSRREGANFNDLRLASENQAKIDGQKITFDEVKGLGPENKIEYQIAVEVKTGQPEGKFEVTATSSALGMTPVKKNVTVTVNP